MGLTRTPLMLITRALPALTLPISTYSAGESIFGVKNIVSHLTSWIQDMPGGFFDDEKLEILPLPYAGGSSSTESFPPMGIFAKRDIAAGEILMKIPHEAYIKVWDVMQREDGSWDVYYNNMCLLAKAFEREMYLGDESFYAPYVNFLRKQAAGQIPATWSDGAKHILRDLLPKEVGGKSNGVDWIDDYFKGSCISPIDPFQEHLVALVKQRSFDDSLLPLWDMVNHANGPHANIKETSLHNDDGVNIMWSSRAIQKGEEVLMSYNRCADCKLVANEWGTPEILRDFGFVEGYPHRYYFEEEEIWFEIVDSVPGNDEEGKQVLWDDHIIWEDGSFIGPPGRKGIEYLRAEIDKFEAIEKLTEKELRHVALNEWNTIMRYKETAVKDFRLAIKEAEKVLELSENYGSSELSADAAISSDEL
mmetsp:Transcript_15906/g.33418  ORF Transcript_15906/g.33418 Transcript_15906/m.33418 type:complete len:420 (-) Transcript_15906:267-1526(-)